MTAHLRLTLTAAVLACACTLLPASPGIAATLYWDGTDTNGDANGGTGSWTTSLATTNWDDAATGGASVAWANSNDAVFGGAAGIVTMATAISAGTLTFSTAGYIIDTTGQALTVTGLSGPATIQKIPGGGASAFNVNLAADTTWNGTVATRINLVKQGARILTISGTLSTPTVTVQGGTLKFDAAATLTANAADAFVQNAGTILDLNGKSWAIKQFTLNANTTLTSATSATLSINPGTDATVNTLAGSVGGATALSIGRGVTNVSGTNSSTGSTTIAPGTAGRVVPVNATSASPFGTGTVTLNGFANPSPGQALLYFNVASPTIGGLASNTSGTRRVILGGTSTGSTPVAAVNLTVGGNNASTTYSGTIEQNGLTTGALTKTGTGTLTLSGAASYTGVTTITDGTLLLDATGSITSTQLDVQAGTFDASAAASLPTFTSVKGAGTIKPGSKTVNVTGTLAPGNSPGTLTIDGVLALGASSTSNYELLGTNTVVGGGVNDLVTGLTNLTLDGTLNVTETVAGSFLSASLGNTWRLFNYTGTLTDSGLSFGSMPALGSGLEFDIDTATAGQVNLVVALIPEPASLALALLGGLLVLPRRARA